MDSMDSFIEFPRAVEKKHLKNPSRYQIIRTQIIPSSLHTRNIRFQPINLYVNDKMEVADWLKWDMDSLILNPPCQPSMSNPLSQDNKNKIERP